jgi:hypothetical protein
MFIVFNITTVSNIYIIGSNADGCRNTGLTNSLSPNASYAILKKGINFGATISGVTNANTVLATTTVNTSSSQTTASLNGGTPSTASNISSFNAGTTYIGKDANQTGFSGRFMEIMIYNSVLSNNQIQNIEGYLAWKWNLQTSLPASHPYKSYSPFTITGAAFTSIQQNQIIRITSGTGTITFDGISKIDILVVGGGGAGGKDSGGGGGGAGGAGLPAKTTSTPYGGNGGPGYSSNITGTSSVYAGGGGGGTYIPNGGAGTPSSGGSGGGGAGGAGNLSAFAGTPNTGGGGGGGGFNNQGLPGAGGSGIIIIRYYII